MTAQLRLDQCGLHTCKKTRLHRILYKHGLANGTCPAAPGPATT